MFCAVAFLAEARTATESQYMKNAQPSVIMLNGDSFYGLSLSLATFAASLGNRKAPG